MFIPRTHPRDGGLRRGLTHDGKTLAHGESTLNDDSLVLYFTKALR